jgi:hypothetical protein
MCWECSSCPPTCALIDLSHIANQASPNAHGDEKSVHRAHQMTIILNHHTTPRIRAYDPAEYAHLQVAPEIQELFGYITRCASVFLQGCVRVFGWMDGMDVKGKPSNDSQANHHHPITQPYHTQINQPTNTHTHTHTHTNAHRYQPQEVEIETPLKCFIPDYLPAVGEMDAFLKVVTQQGKGGIWFVDLLACLLACLFVYLFVCLFVCVFVCVMDLCLEGGTCV